MNTTLKQTIENLSIESIDTERKEELQPLVDYIQAKVKADEVANLNFICTHNSRRSQLSQAWGHAMGQYFGITVNSLSGGVEETAFYTTGIDTLKSQGFDIQLEKESNNPVYRLKVDQADLGIEMFSKIFDNPINEHTPFAAVMTCSHADQNCPFIPGTEKRISLPFEDPKAFDGTPQEVSAYLERSLQIARELKYVFSSVKS